jgi:branched-chain amino acid transport system ATP-binding protein
VSDAATTPLFEARGLTRRFHGLVAVNDVTFAVKRGEILGLIGPNGAGKTTLISLISGTLMADSGELIFEGQRINHLKPFQRAHRGIGRTFQVMKPFPGLSVLQNVTVGALFGFGGGEHDRARARQRAAQMLDFTGLASRRDQRADALGGPDRKRLELAKALALRPKLLLLDEVMAGLRPVEVDRMVATFTSLSRETGLTILLTEHVMRAVMALSHKIVVLHHGQKIAEGSPETVSRDPLVLQSYLGGAAPAAAAF